MGRTKKTSEKIEHQIDPDSVVQEVQTGNNEQKEYIVLRKKKTYTFRSTIPGMIFYLKEDGTAGAFDGHETKEDITEKERKMIVKNDVYKKGFLVEVLPDDEPIDNIAVNALTDEQMAVFLKKCGDNTVEIERWIDSMDSEISLNRLKAVLADMKMPLSLQGYCDYRLKKMEEAYLESQKAPIDEFKG